jgi:ATP-binding cassette, subfamily B, bacterial MsbA
LRATFKRYKPYLKEYKLQFFYTIVGIGLTVTATAAVAQVMQPLIDEVLVAKDAQMLKLIPFIVIGIYIAKAAGRYIQSIAMGYIGLHIVTRLRTELLEKMLHLEMAFMHEHHSGQLISRIMSDISRVRYFVSTMLAELVRESLTVVALIIYVIQLNPRLAMYALVAIPLIIYPLILIAKRLKRYSHRSQVKNADVVARLSETFNNGEIIKANATEVYEVKRFDRENWKFFKIRFKAILVGDAVPPLLEIIASGGIGAVIFIGGSEVVSGRMTPGELTAFLTAVGLMLDPVRRVGAIYSKMQDAIAATERIFTIRDRETGIEDGTRVLDADIAAIEFSGVGLRYGEKQALDAIDFSVGAGQHIALVGDSGGGKSSLINLLLRFYDTSDGEIRINGTPIREFTQASLRHHIALVSQRVYIFNDTLAANVAYGQEIDEARVMEALRLSDAEAFVAVLPEGIHTIMEEFGANLSGGQRQRIAIARTIYKHASLLLLDEATSALDNESEKRIQQALEAYAKDKITITIAHRLSTIEHADCIYVFKEGRIVGTGTYKELLEHSEEFQKLAGKMV